MNSSYSQLYRALRKNAVVHEVETIPAAMKHLFVYPSPLAVLVTDAAISQREYGPLVARLVAYARAGGRVVLGCQFSNHLDSAQSFFQRWGLPWDAGSYHRTTFALNPAGLPTPVASAALFPSYSMKALHIANVARAAAVYVPTDDSRIESRVFAPMQITGTQLEESPAVFVRVGAGYLGFVGDVNGEQGSLRLLIEMCGIKVKPGDLGPRRIGQGAYEEEAEISLPARRTEAPVRTVARPMDHVVALRAAVRSKRAEESRAIADRSKEQVSLCARRFTARIDWWVGQ